MQDNLSTHTPASLYAAFPPAEARPRRAFQWHYTFEHRSWLNMAECELAVLAGRCLDRRMDDKAPLVDRHDAIFERAAS